jgi:hypothetical protein
LLSYAGKTLKNELEPLPGVSAPEHNPGSVVLTDVSIATVDSQELSEAAAILQTCRFYVPESVQHFFYSQVLAF